MSEPYPPFPAGAAGATALDGPQDVAEDDSDILPLTEYSPESRW